MKLLISALCNGKYVNVYDEEVPKYCDVDVTPYKWDTKPEEYRVKVVSLSRVTSFLVAEWRVHLFYRQAKPRFTVVMPPANGMTEPLAEKAESSAA